MGSPASEGSEQPSIPQVEEYQLEHEEDGLGEALEEHLSSSSKASEAGRLPRRFEDEMHYGDTSLDQEALEDDLAAERADLRDPGQTEAPEMTPEDAMHALWKMPHCQALGDDDSFS